MSFLALQLINNSKLKLKSISEDIELVVFKGRLKLTLKTETNKNEFVMCMGPKDGDMIDLVNEILNGKVKMKLEDTIANKNIFDGIGYSTEVEHGGYFKNILSDNI